MIIIGQASWPSESTQEMGRRFKRLSALPPYLIGRDYIKAVEGVGVKVISVYHCEQGRLIEALDVCQKRYAEFFGVAGFSFAVDIWSEVQDALELIGLEGG